MPVQVPGLDPVTFRAVRDRLRALQVQNSEALRTLRDVFQVERIDRIAVSADLADEPLALAKDASEDVLTAEPGDVAK